MTDVGARRDDLSDAKNVDGLAITDVVVRFGGHTAVNRMSLAADEMHKAAEKDHTLTAASYKTAQANLYAEAERVVNGPKPKDADGDD